MKHSRLSPHPVVATLLCCVCMFGTTLAAEESTAVYNRSILQIDTMENCLRMSNDSSSVYIYHGVPYAHAQRFRMPEIVNGIEGSDNYTHSYITCYQRINKQDPSIQYGESHVVLAEDEESPLTENCLVLTINSPFALDKQVGSALPVLVYIHGGNYYAGGGERTNTQLAEFALRENAVTVTVTYRLGAFGYLYQPDSSSVNLGLQDQLTALRWVSENIYRFGGDKDNITVAGQSAGAQSVVYCLADTGRISIKRAIVFSAPMGLTTGKCIATQRTHYIRKYAAKRGFDIWTCPADTLLAAQLAYMDSHPQQWHALPFSPTALAQMPKYGKRVNWPEQVVVSAQAQDGSMFGPKVAWRFVTRYVFTSPAQRYVRYLQKQGVDAHYHLYTWQPRGSELQAAHCAELPLILDGTDEFWIGSWIMGDVTREELQPMRDKAMDDIAEYMRTGKWNM